MDPDVSIADSEQRIRDCIRANNGNVERAFAQYLSALPYRPVDEFPTGLEWFNVAAPLTFQDHLNGKIVLLDFFTYCCINCIHIIPDLREIEHEFPVEEGLLVMGVHTPKFTNEKSSSNILSAVQRYNIAHPVVNDHQSEIWRNCDVHCWPTLLMIAPNGVPIVMLMGEGHKNTLRLYIRAALAYYNNKGLISHSGVRMDSAYRHLPTLKGPLLFPGKIASYKGAKNEVLAVSDTGNHRILLLDSNGTVQCTIGGRKCGFTDGSLADAEFNSPQGLVFLNENVLFVADTENHAIRRVDFTKKTVVTVVGNGHQGDDKTGGGIGGKQVISSPWDLCVYQAPDGASTKKPVLVIAMAGTHQIWALFLDTTTWWRNTKMTAGSCHCIAGNGREENRNNTYAEHSAFAQPSGVDVHVTRQEVYVADSESSTVRRLALVDGKVSPVVGATRNPNNLFAFGDSDGSDYDVKLQHLLGVAIPPPSTVKSNHNENLLLAVDTYNHKLKVVDVEKNTAKTVLIAHDLDPNIAEFNEPAGLAFSCVDPLVAYLADTNNHAIKKLTFDTSDYNKITRIERINLCNYSTSRQDDRTNSSTVQMNDSVLQLNSGGGKLLLNIYVKCADDLKLNQDAPTNWMVHLPNSLWAAVPINGVDFTHPIESVISVPNNLTTLQTSDECYIDVTLSAVLCRRDCCLPKTVRLRLPIEFMDEAPMDLCARVNVTISEKHCYLITEVNAVL